ncbi:hypothetical protein OQJ19_06405 [Fluoribacter gormanii]|uniref:hypothetical protein n=1 Tax=Fluoribacter gormanii TaxID=464 RepID=UPI0022438024|nr:hypothetical protein [Fluoribacter gormanii]MCW8470286.1 hypothetical protein [Fluoribacter gormanii]
MSTGKTEKDKPTPQENQASPPPPPKPDVITPDISEGPAPKSAKDEDKKPQQQEEAQPKKPTQQKGESKEKNPYLELNEQLSQMVADINGDINSALKAAGSKALDKFSQTELGQALGGLKDALNEKAGEIKDQLLDKADEKLDDLKNTKAGQAALQFKEMVSSIQDVVNSGLVNAIKGATAKLNSTDTQELNPSSQEQDYESGENPDEELADEKELSSPNNSTSSNLMAEFNEAFEGMDFDALVEQSPSPSPSPSQSPSLDDEPTSTVTKSFQQ